MTNLPLRQSVCDSPKLTDTIFTLNFTYPKALNKNILVLRRLDMTKIVDQSKTIIIYLLYPI